MGIRGRAAALAALALLLAACGGSSKSEAKKPPAPYSYNRAVPLAFEDAGRVNGAYPIAIHDVSFAGPGGDRIEAFLATPPGTKKVPAVIYLHGAGEDRRRFELPATWAAAHNAVGMTLTLPSSTVQEASGLTPQQSLARQRRIFVDDVVTVRRAIDLLRAQPRVDPSRIGLVGWSLGARVGAVAAGVDPRLKAVVLMSGGAQPVSQYVAQTPAELRPQVKRTLTLLDPLGWLGKAKGAILLQDGRQDEVVPRKALEALVKAAPKGAAVKWYPAGHELNPQAYHDQYVFLTKQLPLTGPSVPGADKGP